MTIEAMKQALEALEFAADKLDYRCEYTITALRAAIASYSTAIHATELREQAEKSNIKQVIHLYDEPPAAPVQESVAWVDLLKQADEIVRSKPLWKKFIDGTPLANDIAVWMASFAQEHTTPPAAQRQWVGLTDAEILEVLCIWPDADDDPDDYMEDIREARAIEAKLREKNGGQA